jgi:hypothetical protein
MFVKPPPPSKKSIFVKKIKMEINVQKKRKSKKGRPQTLAPGVFFKTKKENRLYVLR